jgi:hypothetical protein
MFTLLVHFLLLKIDHVEPFMEMNNQIIIMAGILSVILLLLTITPEFLTLTASNAFGQQVMFDNIDKDISGGPALDTTRNNNDTTDYNIVAISTTTGTNEVALRLLAILMKPFQ